MAQQVRLHNSLWFVFLLLLGCKSKEPNTKNLPCVEFTQGDFRNMNGVLYQGTKIFSGKVFSLYPDLKDTATIAGYLNGQPHGIWKKLYPNHKLQEIRTFNKGKKVGQYTAYWENGNKKLEYYFVNDEYQGTCREWNATGGLIKEMNYVNGYEAGSQKMFYDNGKVRANYVIKNGRRYGLLGTKNCVNAKDSIAFMPK